MKKMLIMAMALGLVGSAFAQNQRTNRDKSEGNCREEREAQFEKMVEEIPNISEDQKKKIYSIHEKYVKENEQQRAAHKNESMTPEERQKLSVEERKAMIDRKHQAMAEMEKRRVDEREDIHQVLTDEQVKFIQEKRKERAQKAPGKKGCGHCSDHPGND